MAAVHSVGPGGGGGGAGQYSVTMRKSEAEGFGLEMLEHHNVPGGLVTVQVSRSGFAGGGGRRLEGVEEGKWRRERRGEE